MPFDSSGGSGPKRTPKSHLAGELLKPGDWNIPEVDKGLPTAVRVEYAAGLWSAGFSVASAAAHCGVDRQTLRYRLKRSGGNELQARRKFLAEAFDAAHEIALEAGRHTLEALDRGEIEGKQAAVVFGIASDKLAWIHRHLGESSATNSPAERLLDLLEKGGTLTVQGPAAPDPVIEARTVERPDSD